jgi:hypothetical protein
LSEAVVPVTLWIVTPVYFDVPSFLQLRERLQLAVGNAGNLPSNHLRFVAVDDTAGRDPDVCQLGSRADTTLVQPPFNLGHQRAIVYGLRRILPEVRNDDIVVTMDSDGEDRPEDLPRLVTATLRHDQHDRYVALALRTHREESALFKVLYFFFRILFRGLTGVVIKTGNYAAYRGSLARQILQHPHFDLCYSSAFFSLDTQADQVPCPRGTRYAGSSHMTLPRLLTHGLRMLMPFLDRIAARALVGSSMIFGLGVIFALIILSVRLATARPMPHWVIDALLLVLVLSGVALGNFILLFAIFSQSRGIALTMLDQPAPYNNRAPVSPAYSSLAASSIPRSGRSDSERP